MAIALLNRPYELLKPSISFCISIMSLRNPVLMTALHTEVLETNWVRPDPTCILEPFVGFSIAWSLSMSEGTWLSEFEEWLSSKVLLRLA
jgi:hypothetical protein